MGSLGSHLGVIFWVILGLGGLYWGPLAFLGPMFGSTSDFDAILDQIREKRSPFWNPFWIILCGLMQFRPIFIMSDFLINFGRDLGGANVDEVL